MRNPLSKQIVEIEPSGIRKFFDIVSEMKDAISLGVGEPDFDTPWHIREEGIYSLEKGRTFYTSNAGLKELKEEISSYLGISGMRDVRVFIRYDVENISEETFEKYFEGKNWDVLNLSEQMIFEKDTVYLAGY